MNKKATIITFASTKGGCGKTALADTLGNYLALKNKKVLLIDLNSQMDLTRSYSDKINKTDLTNSNIYRAFKHDATNMSDPFPSNFKPVHTAVKNIDLMASSKKLKWVNDLLENENPDFMDFVIAHLFSDNRLDHKYDYIIFDTHNDTEAPVKNALLLSDFVLCPVTPSRFGMDSVGDTIDTFNHLKQNLTDSNGSSYIKAKLLFIGNLVEYNTKASNQFREAINGNSDFITYFHKRELFNKAAMGRTSIFSFTNHEKNDRNDRKALDNEIIPHLNQIVKAISK